MLPQLSFWAPKTTFCCAKECSPWSTIPASQVLSIGRWIVATEQKFVARINWQGRFVWFREAVVSQRLLGKRQRDSWLRGMRCRAGKDLESWDTHTEVCMFFPTGGSTWLLYCQHANSRSWNAKLRFTLGCARTLVFVSPAQTSSGHWTHLPVVFLTPSGVCLLLYSGGFQLPERSRSLSSMFRGEGQETGVVLNQGIKT